MKRPPVLIHYHIYKNAGSTIDQLLLSSFGDAFATVEAAPHEPRIAPDALRRFLDERPHLKAISSHTAHPPLPGPNARPIVMLRHPADRARSAWRFARANPGWPDHAAACGSFAEYVCWSLGRRGHGSVLRNHQVLHLSKAALRENDATKDDLAEAQARLARWPAFGLVRRFGQSCRLFNARYRPIYPALRFADTPENTTGDTTHSEAAALAQVRDELGEASYAALCAANILDIALYSHATALFERHLADLSRPARSIGWRLALARTKARNRLIRPSLLARGG